MAESSNDAINTAAPLKDRKKGTDCKREHLAAEAKRRETRLTILCNINKEAMDALNKQQKILGTPKAQINTNDELHSAYAPKSAARFCNCNIFKLQKFLEYICHLLFVNDHSKLNPTPTQALSLDAMFAFPYQSGNLIYHWEFEGITVDHSWGQLHKSYIF